jgi:hypothetical protein
MFDLDQLPELRQRILAQVAVDRRLLDDVLEELRPMGSQVRTIQERSATSVALMAADGGNNRVAFNPFYLQVIRVVDSVGKELLLDVVSPGTDTADLSEKHLGTGSGEPRTALGRLMRDLGANGLHELSRMIPLANKSPSWVLVYRDLCEWATLYDLIVNTRFATDTLIVRDGLLRSKIFAGDLFVQMYRLLQQAIDAHKREHRRNVWLVGLAKKTEVLEYYRLGLTLAKTFPAGSPSFCPVPMALQKRVYIWDEYIRDPVPNPDGEDPKFNIGSMHFVRFGTRSGDPIWTVDLLHSQRDQAQAIFGYLLADAVAGFPIPFYPNSIQKADAHSRVADLDLDIVEDQLVDAIRTAVGPEDAPLIDGLRLATDVAARRYG